MPNVKPSVVAPRIKKQIGKLSEEQIASNFTEMHPPLSTSQAYIEACRCYFCYDAPCTAACPTGIDIPEFIKWVQTGNIKGSARKILEQNIMGGMCARVCPTEELCEEACVRNTHESKPVAIGLLQRFATDAVIANKTPLFERLSATGKRVAVVGAGPAGLSCAHRLASYGHNVHVFDQNEKAGGLNEYGIARYKALNNIAQKEVDYILTMAGIEIQSKTEIGIDVTLDQLRGDFDAVFIAIGLSAVNQYKIPGEEVRGVMNAVNFIRDLRQAKQLSDLWVGDKVVVIGGGMTAIDVAVQSKKLGAAEVTIVYRRDRAHMKASGLEQRYAQINDVKLRFGAAPQKILSRDGRVTGIQLVPTRVDHDGMVSPRGESFQLEADTVFKAIGQALSVDPLGETAAKLLIENGRIVVDDNRKTALDNVWAGGDCIAGGDDLTVCAVQDGKVAAESIHQTLLSN